MSNPITPAHDNFGVKIANALGLDPNSVKELHIHVVPNDVILINTVQYLTVENSEELIEVFKDYELHEKLIENDSDKEI
jgi:hypothetical protein